LVDVLARATAPSIISKLAPNKINTPAATNRSVAKQKAATKLTSKPNIVTIFAVMPSDTISRARGESIALIFDLSFASNMD
jgi:hypothetical protein